MLSSLDLVHGFPRDLSVTPFTSESIVFVSVVQIGLSLQPLFPQIVVLNLHLSSFMLLGCMLNLTKVSVLVFLHAFPANGHVN